MEPATVSTFTWERIGHSFQIRRWANWSRRDASAIPSSNGKFTGRLENANGQF